MGGGTSKGQAQTGEQGKGESETADQSEHRDGSADDDARPHRPHKTEKQGSGPFHDGNTANSGGDLSPDKKKKHGHPKRQKIDIIDHLELEQGEDQSKKIDAGRGTRGRHSKASRKRQGRHEDEDAADEVLNLLGGSPRQQGGDAAHRRKGGDAADDVFDLIESLSEIPPKDANKPRLKDTEWFKKRQTHVVKQSPTALVSRRIFQQTCLIFFSSGRGSKIESVCAGLQVVGKGMAETELEDVEQELYSLDERERCRNRSLSLLNNLTPSEITQQNPVKDGELFSKDSDGPVRYKLMMDNENDDFQGTSPLARYSSGEAVR